MAGGAMSRDLKAGETSVLKDQLLEALHVPEPIDTSALLEGARRRTREGPVPHDAICLDCGYSLRGLCYIAGKSIYYGRCPECGRWFDPDDSSTFGTKGAQRPADRLGVALLFAALAAILFSLVLQAL